ncbi:SPRY domain-containing protein 7 isoform X1 [Eschrichtius robustus]|uniref:SPRY domain-containing protein 7 isoform X1 n=1 Tax=Eschrichtius robustus TaxID=9764 RepID=UPI0035C25A26
MQESLWTSVLESSPKGQPSWQQKVDVITNKDLGRISKTVPTKSAVQKNLCKRRKTKVEPHESREKAKGTDVVIVKNGRRICGTGGCLASAPLHQNKSYFEFKIQSTGIWGIGVATQKVNLNQIPLGRDVHSLVMRNDGALYHNNEEKNRLPANNLPQEGDVVGITYDHVELNVYLNGKNMHCPASGIRGTVYPVVYVDDSAILDCQFSEFYHTPPPGFEKILFEQQIF